MSEANPQSGKLPGKTTYSGRRRTAERTSGFSVHDGTTGGEFCRKATDTHSLAPGELLEVTFSIRGQSTGDLVGFGVWFKCDGSVSLASEGGPSKSTLTNYSKGSWGKFGSIWSAPSDRPIKVKLIARAQDRSSLALYAPRCGVIAHRHLRQSRPELLRNMHQFAPEAVFVEDAKTGSIHISRPISTSSAAVEIILKSCNRCGRFLPINTARERDQLSFSNHCVAEHRRPCRHATFGRLRNIEDPSDLLALDYGFQLECRFCKKFEVNAALNPQRTAAQMKEDGARRRAFELLLRELFGGTPHLRYRHLHGTELSDDVWKKFGRKCFNCGTSLPTPRAMHLDHTRPLALLWPLDETATALCGSCNSEKRDRAPTDFYSPGRLRELSGITGIQAEVLESSQPNDEALKRIQDRIDWLFNVFLARPEMRKVRDGKVAGELVIKAISKVFARSRIYRGFDLQGELERRRGT